MLHRFVLCGIGAAIAAAVLPPLAAATTGAEGLSKRTVVVALLGMCTGAAWVVTAALWQRRHEAIAGPIIALVAVVVVFAGFVARDPERNWDYIYTYELPTQQLLSGVNPYEAGETTNPPTWSQLTSLVATVLAQTVLVGAAGDDLWFWVFYVYQVLQLALVAALFALCYTVALTAGSTVARASIVAAIGMLACAPLHEAFLLNQINLLVLVLAMAAVMLAERHPVWAGAAAAFGGAVKLYPFGVWLYWIVTRRWLPVLWSALILGVIITAGWTAWSWYFGYLIAFERPMVVRDASLHGTISSVIRLSGGMLGLPQNAIQASSFLLWLAADAAVVYWLWRRHAHRHFSWEFLAVLPLLFPLAWVHHYLLVLPLAVSHVASRAAISLLAGAGILLVLVLPAFDTFPLGITRPLGTLLLLAAQRDEVDE